ncbi:hypothetical protein SAY86_006671 [Trapa natans]|uniref:tRNA pseudouridine(55) synthase n=1 Tax=Trapa natans TaxID=22666 RepID=A0AAN7KZ96_TRANT|nr:hypothetical protein SAY86_006671 [Trapa natans]
MAVSLKSLSFTHKSFRFLRPILFPTSPLSVKLLSTTSTPYPLQYEMIINRPSQPPPGRLARSRPGRSDPSAESPDDPDKPDVDLGFDDWVDRKLSSEQQRQQSPSLGMDKSKRKYYKKRMKRMFGSDSEDERRRERDDGFVELKPEVVEFSRLHKREEELYFYDAFAYPWEKNKHYKMVYQLEKKYFPEYSLDKAFLEPGQPSSGSNVMKNVNKQGTEAVGDDKRWVFFEEDEQGVEEKGGEKKDVVERKVDEFFKCLKKVPSENVEEVPYVLTRTTELPPRWDGPHGTVVLVNKPKGWTSFTVCGKLRRLVKVKKVGHAGTLDPMATGLLIVCVGKATKIVDNYQGMVKGYSGVFRLGEATSTWDADSPVRFTPLNEDFNCLVVRLIAFMQFLS